jgi:predicted secreted acid phosphatase
MKNLIIFIFILVIILIITHLNKKEQFMKRKNVPLEQIKNDLYLLAYDVGIEHLKKTKVQNKGAVMFDIDDTLLEVIENDSGRFNLKPIKPIINLLNECIKNGLLVIIITARDSIYKTQTIKDLNKWNIKYSGLYCRQSPEQDYEGFKSDIKEHLFNEFGVKILLSVGDNWIDIIGDYSGYCIKLPNKSDPHLYYGNNKNLTKI